MDRMAIGRRLKALRGSRSQAEVGRAVGVGTSAICNYENGLRVPPDDTKIKLAKYYKTTVNRLFYAQDNTERESDGV